ncbi:hypothetical protein VKT23_007797 [Stygiomarasmius scandens]|uniref:Uncharacterized protein n=1 Tax=Marasmiellus scandens TaxID=2682957 RepID=A0ABR1JJ10_9AGAR
MTRGATVASLGEMKAFGQRLPAGGRRHDGLAPYTGMELAAYSTLEECVNIHFDHAEDALILEERARSAIPRLVAKIRDNSADCAKVGRYGANLFRCDGYTAAMHSEKDAGSGLCSQIEWHADRNFHEFGFIFLEYGVYLVTQPNMLWSFDADSIHGTMLPSQETMNNMLSVHSVSRIRGGAVGNVSSGVHNTVRKKDANRAKKHAQIQRTQKLREKTFST